MTGRAGPKVRHGRTAPQVSDLLGSTISDVDWCDAFWVELPRDSPEDPLFWRDQLFGSREGRPSGLLRLRDLLARQVGLKNAASANGASYPVLARDAREVVVGMDDRHLDFRVALAVRPRGHGPAGRGSMVITTAVRRHNRFGRAYFAIVKVPHLVLVPHWARRAVRRTAGSPAA